MARLYYRVKLEGLLAFRGVLKRVERFDDSPRVQNWYDKLTVGCSKTSRHLFNYNWRQKRYIFCRRMELRRLGSYFYYRMTPNNKMEHNNELY